MAGFAVTAEVWAIAVALSTAVALALAPQIRNIRLAYWFFLFATLWMLGRLFAWTIENADSLAKYLMAIAAGIGIVAGAAFCFAWVKQNVADVPKSTEPVGNAPPYKPSVPAPQAEIKKLDKPPTEVKKPIPEPRRRQDSKDLKRPTQPQNNITNPTGSILNQNSPNYGSQTVNNGPPEPKITVSTAELPLLDDDKKYGVSSPGHVPSIPMYKAKVTIRTDLLISSPGFALTFDGPIITARAQTSVADSAHTQEVFDSTDGVNLNVFKVYFIYPHSLPAGGEVYVYVWASQPVKLLSCGLGQSIREVLRKSAYRAIGILQKARCFTLRFVTNQDLLTSALAENELQNWNFPRSDLG